MKKVLTLATSVALVAGGLAYATTVLAPRSEEVREVLSPLGLATGDGGTQVVKNPTYTISAPEFQLVPGYSKSTVKMKDAPRTPIDKKEPKLEAPKVRPEPMATVGSDKVVQTSKGTSTAINAGSGFAGLNLSANGAGWPPDTNGDIGPGYYVQAVNSSVGIFNSSTGELLSQPTLNNFFRTIFPSSSPCYSNNQGDPVVLFDRIAQQWIVTNFNWSNIRRGPFYECIGVSNTADPTGYWHGFAMVADSGSLMNDYPKLSSTPNAILMTANQFKGGSTYAGVRVWALDRTTLFGTTGAALKVLKWDLGTGYYSVLPVNVQTSVASGNASAVGGYFVSDYGSTSRINLWQLSKPTWSASTPSATLSPAVAITTPTYNSWSGRIAQKGSSETVDALADRLMAQAQYIETASSFTIHTVRTAKSSTTAGIRWTMMSRSSTASNSAVNYTVKAGTYAPSDTTNRFMPSIAVNSKGELAMGFTASSSSMYPAVVIAGMTAGQANPTVDIPEFVKAGTGSQSGGYNRWGDYSAMSVDPDGCKFWFTTEYYSSTGNNWQTWIQPITLTSCP